MCFCCLCMRVLVHACACVCVCVRVCTHIYIYAEYRTYIPSYFPHTRNHTQACMQVRVDEAERLLAAFPEYDAHAAARHAFQEELKAGGITSQRQSELLKAIAALSTVMVGAGTVSRLWLRTVTVGGGPRGGGSVQVRSCSLLGRGQLSVPRTHGCRLDSFLLAGRVSVQRGLTDVMSEAQRRRTPKVREAAFPCEGALRACPSVVLARAAIRGGDAEAHPGRASDER